MSQRPHAHHNGVPHHPSRSTASGPRRGERRRTLSQNFLTDASVARRLVRLAGVGPNDLVVEVGAGDGMVTRALASATRRLTAYELDPSLAARLTRRYGHDLGVRIVQGDFLRTDPPRTPFTLVGNIPYAITSPILDWCLHARHLTSAGLITQLEYARKRTGDYGRWTRVTVQSWPQFHWTLGGRVTRHRFHPVPRVDSAILLLRRRTTPLVPPADMAAYHAFVAAGFTGVGGSLRASLRHHYPRRQVDAAFRLSGVDGRRPVGAVSADEWCAVFQSATFTP